MPSKLNSDIPIKSGKVRRPRKRELRRAKEDMVDLKIDNLVARLLLQESARLDENAVACETSSKKVNVREIRARMHAS